MVAYAPHADRFAPVDPPRVAVSADGSLAAIHEASRITLLELPSGTPFAEIGADPDALASEVGWVSVPPRLLVLSRYDAHSTAHLIDPHGPSTIAEIRLEATMRLAATVGSWALVVGSLGAAVLTSGESHLTAYQFPARVVPVTAGPAASLFLVALASSVEEWDPQSRAPRRRLRLPRTAAITAVGGSERLVWMTTQQEPARIDVIPIVNRGQPRGHDLPEPILLITGHPRSDLVACIGADSGRLYIVDLDGRTRLRVIDPAGIDRVDAASLVIGRMTGVLAARARHPIAIVRLDGRDADDSPSASSSTMLLASGPSRQIVIDERDVVDHGRAPPIAIHAMSPVDESAHLSQPAMAKHELTSGSQPEIVLDELAHRSQPEIALDESDPGSQPKVAVDESDRGSQPEVAVDESDPGSQPEPAVGESDPGSQPAIALDESARGAPPAPPLAPPASGRQGTSSAVHSASALPTAKPPLTSGKVVPSVSERFSAWRDMVRQSPTLTDPNAVVRPAAPPVRSEVSIRNDTLIRSDALIRGDAPVRMEVSPVRSDTPRSWRDELVDWSRSMGAAAPAPSTASPPSAPALDALVARFELDPRLQPVLARLYSAHLRGEVGAAPVDIARMLDRQWDEALGRGELARSAVCEYVRSRVALSPVILRVLDELPPLTGTLIGAPGHIALLGPCIVVAGDEPLSVIAERCLPRVGGAILVANPDVRCAPLVFEARAYGAAAMLRTDRPEVTTSHDPVIFVVDDDDLAEDFGIPYLT
jgi:hypothetical protein